MSIWCFGEDPLTWCFVKLLGIHIRKYLVEYHGIPGSIAWPVLESTGQNTSIIRKRLITKAQVSGIVISIQHKAERVEFLVDDGTALIPAVLWLPEAYQERRSVPIALGDLVHFEGKLHREARRDNFGEPNQIELRILRYSVMEDPNEEVAHWLETIQLCREVYSSTEYLIEPSRENSFGSELHSSKAKGCEELGRREGVALKAFLEMEWDPILMETSENDGLDRLFMDVIQKLIDKQKNSEASAPIRVTFTEMLHDFELDGKIQVKHDFVRLLRLVFSELRSLGLLHLFDPETDVHVLQTHRFTLKSALMSLLQGSPHGQSFTDIAGAILQKNEFQHISVEWLRYSLQKLIEEELISKHNDKFSILLQ